MRDKVYIPLWASGEPQSEKSLQHGQLSELRTTLQTGKLILQYVHADDSIDYLTFDIMLSGLKHTFYEPLLRNTTQWFIATPYSWQCYI